MDRHDQKFLRRLISTLLEQGGAVHEIWQSAESQEDVDE
jgi:hypothetical protein